MKLEEFLKNNPKLVEDLKECKGPREVDNLVRTAIPNETIEKIDALELKTLSMDDLDRVSGGNVVNMLGDSEIGGIAGWILCQSLVKSIYNAKITK